MERSHTHIMLLEVVLQAREDAVDKLAKLELYFNLEGSRRNILNDLKLVYYSSV